MQRTAKPPRRRPPAEAARPCRPHRHRLHRHGGKAQQPRWSAASRMPQARSRPHPLAASATSVSWRCRVSACVRAFWKARPRNARTAKAPASSDRSSVALAVLRGLEDAVMAGSRTSLTAVTTPTVALYILNKKRAFISDMEARHGLPITVEGPTRYRAPISPSRKGAPAHHHRRPREGRGQYELGLRERRR